jgi:rhodanese-related sulfurtransferase/predicted transcriptional regulator
VLFDALASVAKALGHGRRAELVDVLSHGERHVDDLADTIDQSVANTSHHLQQLLRAGLVRTRREGNRIYYSLASSEVTALWLAMEKVASEHVQGVEELVSCYVGDRSDLEAVTREQLLERLALGDVVVLDVRDEPEYAAGHLPGAIHVPPAEIQQRLAQLPDGVTVVAYCRGPFCITSDDAVRTLTAAGRKALRLEDGYPEWAAAGLPVEKEYA